MYECYMDYTGVPLSLLVLVYECYVTCSSVLVLVYECYVTCASVPVLHLTAYARHALVRVRYGAIDRM